MAGRTLLFVINGQQSGDLPVGASVPQGSVLGPVLWNLYIDDLLRGLPAISAYADDCTLSLSYPRQDSRRAIADVNQQLGMIAEWIRSRDVCSGLWRIQPHAATTTG